MSAPSSNVPPTSSAIDLQSYSGGGIIIPSSYNRPLLQPGQQAQLRFPTHYVSDGHFPPPTFYRGGLIVGVPGGGAPEGCNDVGQDARFIGLHWIVVLTFIICQIQ
jgi:hypothetical protein